jgi:hypothetical protein
MTHLDVFSAPRCDQSDLKSRCSSHANADPDGGAHVLCAGALRARHETEPLDRAYDRMILEAAKTWTYRPATRNGVAVKYRKRIQLALPRQTN